MTPRCRRSARIASSSKKNRDSPAPYLLASVAEADTETVETPSKPSSRAIAKMASSPMPAPSTPSGAAPPKLAMSEMHPSKAHQTMGPPSSGLRNGFTDIDYTKTPMQSLVQNTPSKTPVPSSDFTFRAARLGRDGGLGPEAREMMDSLREEAAAIKEALREERFRERAERRESSMGRKIATARGKSGRFSAAHMAEFKKMDSIEGHASAFRAAAGRHTPVKAGTSSNTPVTPLKPGLKRSPSKANLDEPESARARAGPSRTLAKSKSAETVLPPHAAKRVRQHIEDDASSRRPVSRDATSIPRPKSSGADTMSSGMTRSQTMGSLMTPTKSALSRNPSLRTPTVTLVKSPSHPDLSRMNSFSAKVGTGIARSPTKTNLEQLTRSPSKKYLGLRWGSSTTASAEGSSVPSRIETPGRFDRIKSILKRQASASKPKSGIPQLTASSMKTPTRPGVTETMFPPVPLTSPGKKQERHVDFTPETKRAAMAQNSPSPVKSSIPRSKTLPKVPAPKFTAGGKGAASPKAAAGEVAYPDLSAYQADGDESEQAADSVPGTFTFRSDHTIQVETSPSMKFGSAAGQASLRRVRQSTAPTKMPGSFPFLTETSPDKENDAPFANSSSIPHGITNKKRHRASDDEEDEDEDEGAKRGGKKLRKNPVVAEGHALVAPRLLAKPTPRKKAVAGATTPQTPSPQKKKMGLSLSRLQMLAQPKIRK